MNRLKAHRRRSVAVLAVLALVALGIGVSAVLAAGTAIAPIQNHNDACGENIGTSPIGSVTFTKINKTTLRTAVTIKRGVPFDIYTVELFSPDSSCSTPLATLGTFTTGPTGQGNHTFTSSTFGQVEFFINANDGLFDNESVTALVDG